MSLQKLLVPTIRLLLKQGQTVWPCCRTDRLQVCHIYIYGLQANSTNCEGPEALHSHCSRCIMHSRLEQKVKSDVHFPVRNCVVWSS